MIGFVMEVAASLLPLHNVYIRNGLLISGVLLIIVGMLQFRKDNPFVDKSESIIADDIGFDFNGYFKEYKNVLSTKEGTIKYSKWRDDLLRKFNRYGQEGKNGKKHISADVRFYLKESKRRAEEKVETVKSIMVPAEFGIVASVYELDIAPISDETAFAIVMILSLILVAVCTVEINSGNKIVKFIDDFCEVLEIPLESGK